MQARPRGGQDGKDAPSLREARRARHESPQFTIHTPATQTLMNTRCRPWREASTAAVSEMLAGAVRGWTAAGGVVGARSSLSACVCAHVAMSSGSSKRSTFVSGATLRTDSSVYGVCAPARRKCAHGLRLDARMPK